MLKSRSVNQHLDAMMRRLIPVAWTIGLVLVACINYPIVLLFFVPAGFAVESVEPSVTRAVMLYLVITLGLFEVGCLGAAWIVFMNWIKRVLRLAQAGRLEDNWHGPLAISRIRSPCDLLRPIYALCFATGWAFVFSLISESLAIRRLASTIIVIGSLVCGIVWLRGAHSGVKWCGRLTPIAVSILWLVYGLVAYSMPVNKLLPQALACACVFAAELCGVYFVARWCAGVMDLLETLIALRCMRQDQVQASRD